MSFTPLVSVVMPVYDSARFLRQALETVVAQTYSPVEIVVVDGPSSDATPAIARSFPGVRYRRQAGVGMWNALNEGVAAARGELIAFLSDDDLWHPDKLRLQVELLRQHPEVGYAGGRMKFVEVEGDTLPSSFRPELLIGDREGYMPEAVLVRRAVFDRLGGFPESMRITSDIDWLMRSVDQGVKRMAVGEVVLFKRCHSGNLSTLPSTGATMNRELLQLARARIQRQAKSS